MNRQSTGWKPFLFEPETAHYEALFLFALGGSHGVLWIGQLNFCALIFLRALGLLDDELNIL